MSRPIVLADESHHVSFIFDVEESVFVKTHQQRVETLTRVATMFALLLSAISGMRFFKTYLELIIDTICLRCYPKNLPKSLWLEQTFVAKWYQMYVGSRGTASTVCR